MVNPSRLDYATQVFDLGTRQTPRNLKVRGCALSDLSCSRPVTESIVPNADGWVVLPLTEGFDGFLELTADDMAPTLFVFTGELSPELVTLIAAQPIVMLSLESVRNLQASFGTPVSPEAGAVAITALDCDGRPAAGVRFDITPTGVPFALISGLPVVQRDTTAADGIVGFFNVTAGVALVDATIVALDAALEQKTVPVRTGWTSQLTLLPARVPFD